MNHRFYTLARLAALVLALAVAAWYVAVLRRYGVPPLMLAATSTAVGWIVRESLLILAARFGPQPATHPEGADVPRR